MFEVQLTPLPAPGVEPGNGCYRNHFVFHSLSPVLHLQEWAVKQRKPLRAQNPQSATPLTRFSFQESRLVAAGLGALTE